MSGESLSEWRSCEQVENGSPSTSPPFWDTDDVEDPGPKPSDLFGRHTWKIEKFSKEKKREMKSEPFEAGGYKWYILVYPQGCDVSNHLSLFLCVANHEKLLPGWSHFAQFTIAVGNMDPKKVKYSDTLHRFWKKEHDWGWKKFMELSKIQDGFLVDDVLEIIAQVQVIREKVDRPFRCLNRSYRRELLCVYMTNIEQIYRRFVEERKSKLSKLIEDRMRWSSFRAFWLAIDPSTRYHMSREKTDAILKILVKHFFVEKEVTSTLVMDSLYTGLKALEYQSKDKKGRTEVVELEELPAPMVHVDIDMFVLAGDVIALLERAALEPLPYQPVSPKDDKCSQSRTKDGSSGEVNKVSIEREERRLTELGQKILETFVLSHIFSGIEVAYQEAVALKRQEELIREEEAAGLLENEMKGKRGGGATEKEKRAKKKQAKQKKNNRKVKDREKEEKSDANILQRLRDERAIDDSDGLPSKQADKVTSEVDPLEEVASDLSDNIDGLVDVCQRYSSDKNSRPMIGVNDADSEIQNARTGKKKKYAEHNSTTCLAESAAVNIMQGKGNTNTAPEIKSPISPNRGKNQRNKATSSISFAQEADSLPSSIAGVSDRNMYGCGTAPKLDQETVLLTLKDQLRRLGQRLHEKEIEGRKLLKVHLGVNSKTKTTGSSSSSSLEKPSNVLKHPEQSLGTTDTKTSAPPNEDAPVMTCTTNLDGVKSSTSTEAKDGVMPNTIISTEAAPIVALPVAPTGTTVELVLSKENVSSSTLQIDEAAPIPSRSPPIDKAAPFPPRSPQVDNAIPACPRLAQVDKAIAVCPGSPQVEKSSSVRPRSPQVEKPSSVPPRSPQVEKPSSVPPRSPKVDKVIPVPSGSPSTSSTSTLDAQKETISANFATANGIATSKPTSIPLFQAPKSTVSATPPVQVSPLLSCSMSEAARSGNDPSHSAPSYVPQTYRNAIVGKPGLGKTPASVAHQSTSLGQGNALSQPLSTYTSATSVMVPPVARNDQLSGRQRFMFGLGKSEALDSWHPWKCDGDANRHLWRDDSPYQQTNSDAFRHPWGDDSYQQAKDYEMEKLGRFGGLQPTQLQASSVSHQSQGPTVEEFPHLDIINELLEEEQSNGSMPESLPHDYHTFGSPFSLIGNLADSQMTSASTSGQFNSTEQYYCEAYPRAYDSTRTLHGMRGAQFSTLDAYSNGRTVWTASKPWLYNYPNPTVNLGINTNGVSQQLAQYANLTSGVNGDFLHRRANGHW